MCVLDIRYKTQCMSPLSPPPSHRHHKRFLYHGLRPLWPFSCWDHVWYAVLTCHGTCEVSLPYLFSNPLHSALAWLSSLSRTCCTGRSNVPFMHEPGASGSWEESLLQREPPPLPTATIAAYTTWPSWDRQSLLWWRWVRWVRRLVVCCCLSPINWSSTNPAVVIR